MTDVEHFEILAFPGAVVAPGGWEALAHVADHHADGLLHVPMEGGVVLHASTSGPIEPLSSAPGTVPTGQIGWIEQSDGLVTLGAAVPPGVLTSHMARMLDVIDTPIVLCTDRVLHITDLDEHIAEQVVRVLAPLGLVFDTNSPLLTEF
ncbi:hypothetical protein HCH15_01370 [Corynebacterium testudinoris]|uniref:hypothetical protein n=1 Tax=Corynebacterium testudinoris TaxID=136857 RepID=UPI001C8CE027|nr:hypothetical protein [Corynebacterium testudinoris]MBX8994834.1 hypothetical protein [Corynebacterium testudinoris]